MWVPIYCRLAMGADRSPELRYSFDRPRGVHWLHARVNVPEGSVVRDGHIEVPLELIPGIPGDVVMEAQALLLAARKGRYEVEFVEGA